MIAANLLLFRRPASPAAPIRLGDRSRRATRRPQSAAACEDLARQHRSGSGGHRGRRSLRGSHRVHCPGAGGRGQARPAVSRAAAAAGLGRQAARLLQRRPARPASHPAVHRLRRSACARMRLLPWRVPRTSGAALVSGFPRERTGSVGETLLIPLIHVLLLGYLPILAMRRSKQVSLGAGCGQIMLADAAILSPHRRSRHDPSLLARRPAIAARLPPRGLSHRHLRRERLGRVPHVSRLRRDLARTFEECARGHGDPNCPAGLDGAARRRPGDAVFAGAGGGRRRDRCVGVVLQRRWRTAAGTARRGLALPPKSAFGPAAAWRCACSCCCSGARCWLGTHGRSQVWRGRTAGPAG